MEQSSWCRSPSGDDSVLDHCCCRGVQNRPGSLGTDVCGLWTSPVPAWTWFGTPLAASATPSGQVSVVNCYRSYKLSRTLVERSRRVFTCSHYVPGSHLNKWVFSSRPPKCNEFNVRLTEFRWQSIPKPWTDDSEAPVTEPGVRPRVQSIAHTSHHLAINGHLLLTMNIQPSHFKTHYFASP